MKVVLDTNVIVSGLLFGGKPLQIIETVVEGKIEAYTSEGLLKELLEILGEKFGLPKERLREIEESIRENFKIISPGTVIKVARDPDDNVVLQVALKSRADYLISGDNDLLVLKSFSSIPILTPGEFLRKLK